MFTSRFLPLALALHLVTTTAHPHLFPHTPTAHLPTLIPHPPTLNRRIDLATDITTSGPFELSNCNAVLPDSHAQSLHALISEARFYLHAHVFLDAQTTPPSLALSTFFSSPQAQGHAAQTFAKMAAGPEVDYLDGKHAVRLTCLSGTEEDSAGLNRIYELACKSRGNDGNAIVLFQETPYLYLCPKFFELPAWPVQKDCPSIVSNAMVPNGRQLMENQFTELVHSLAHLYGMNGGREGNVVERYDVQDCAALKAEEQVRNAPNFAYYAATVRAGCTQFPRGAPTYEISDELRRLQGSKDGQTDPDGGSVNGTAIDQDTAPGAVRGSLDVYPASELAMALSMGNQEPVNPSKDGVDGSGRP